MTMYIRFKVVNFKSAYVFSISECPDKSNTCNETSELTVPEHVFVHNVTCSKGILFSHVYCLYVRFHII